MRRDWARVSFVVGLILVAIGSGALVAWLLWPVRCESTALGLVPGQQRDPNLHGCSTRIGTKVSLDAVRISAVLWGQAASASVLLAGGVAAWSLGWLRTLPRVPQRRLGRTVAILGGALIVGLLIVWALWPDTYACIDAPHPQGRRLLCTTRTGLIVRRETAQLNAVLWGQGVAATIAVGYVGLAWVRSRRAVS